MMRGIFIKRSLVIKIVSSVILTLTLCSLIAITTTAFADNVRTNMGRSGSEYTQPETTTADDYGYDSWNSIEEVMSRYGTDFEYFSVHPFTYGRKTYNYYYKFSDGSRMYFGVLG